MIPVELPYRFIHEEWADLQDNGPDYADMLLSDVLDAMVRMEKQVLAPLFAGGQVNGFRRLSSYGPTDMPEALEVEEGEVLCLHYPIQMLDARDVTTGDNEGIGAEEDYEVGIALLIGHSAWEAPALMSRASNLPHLWRLAYLANALLFKSDEAGAAAMLDEPLALVGRTAFGGLPFAGNPVGWLFTLELTLHYNMRNWYAG